MVSIRGVIKSCQNWIGANVTMKKKGNCQPEKENRTRQTEICASEIDPEYKQ